MNQAYTLSARFLGRYDVIVCGGGIAGVCAAVAAARQGCRTLLLEGMGCLGGTITQGLVPQFLDSENKGGLIREILRRLEEEGCTCPRDGVLWGMDGARRPGAITDFEGVKTLLDTLCQESGVELLLYSHAVHAETEAGGCRSILIGTECGLLSAEATLFIDATGSGTLARLCGCGYEFGLPENGLPQPCSMSMQAAGLPFSRSTLGAQEKNAYGALLAENGVSVSGTQACAIRLPAGESWLLGINFEYGVRPDDIFALTGATVRGRRECYETARRHAKIPGFERLWALDTCEHLGIREGLRIQGLYRLQTADILAGRAFPDGVCTVCSNVDVHKQHAADTVGTGRGLQTQPYEIPYRCLVAGEIKNLLLAGKLISGDFYAFSSYRTIGNMGATGEACGYAAGACLARGVLPAQLDGRQVKAYMKGQGYALR